MKLTTNQMARLAESLNEASREIDIVLQPQVSVTRAVQQQGMLSARLHHLADTLSQVVHHSA